MKHDFSKGKLHFITGNKHKFEEISSVIPNLIQFDVDLSEIQEIDAKEVIRAKLLLASEYGEGEFIVEDTSLYLDCLNGLPGPLIKWFMKTIGNKGLVELTKKYKNNKALAKTFIGHINSKKEIHFFEGELKGKLVSEKKKSDFGWDSIFMPEGYDVAFSQMSQQEKNEISMRRIASDKLKRFLDKQKNI